MSSVQEALPFSGTTKIFGGKGPKGALGPLKYNLLMGSFFLLLLLYPAPAGDSVALLPWVALAGTGQDMNECSRI